MHMFKKMQVARKEIVSNIEFYKTDEERLSLENKKLEALDIIIDYTKSCHWLKRKNSLNRMTALFDFNFDTKKASDYLGVKHGSVRASLTYFSNTLAEAIGKNTIDLIIDGQVESALLQFRTSTNHIKLGELVPSQILDLVPEGEYKGQLLEECKQELIFIKALSFNGLNSKISKLDKDKLALIIRIMSSADDTYSKERLVLYKYINNEITDTDKLFAMLRHSDNLFT